MPVASVTVSLALRRTRCPLADQFTTAPGTDRPFFLSMTRKDIRPLPPIKTGAVLAPCRLQRSGKCTLFVQCLPSCILAVTVTSPPEPELNTTLATPLLSATEQTSSTRPSAPTTRHLTTEPMFSLSGPRLTEKILWCGCAAEEATFFASMALLFRPAGCMPLLRHFMPASSATSCRLTRSWIPTQEAGASGRLMPSTRTGSVSGRPPRGWVMEAGEATARPLSGVRPAPFSCDAAAREPLCRTETAKRAKTKGQHQNRITTVPLRRAIRLDGWISQKAFGCRNIEE